MPISILKDKRKIKALSCDLSRYTWRVGQDGITKIEAYGENGHMAEVIWFAVWAGDEIILRMEGTGKSISYYPLEK